LLAVRALLGPEKPKLRANPTMNAHTKPPGEPQDAPLYLPTEKLFQAIGRLRREARDEIDRLIRFLDDTESHMSVDDEDGDDEADPRPSTSCPGTLELGPDIANRR
jgi:hypothetical protein